MISKEFGCMHCGKNTPVSKYCLREAMIDTKTLKAGDEVLIKGIVFGYDVDGDITVRISDKYIYSKSEDIGEIAPKIFNWDEFYG